MNVNEFSKILKEERIARGLEVRKLAKILGVSACTVWAWEREACHPTLFMREATMKYLGYEFILNGKPIELIDIPSELTEIQRDKKILKKDIAKYCGVSYQVLSHMNGASMDTLCKIAECVGATLEMRKKE